MSSEAVSWSDFGAIAVYAIGAVAAFILLHAVGMLVRGRRGVRASRGLGVWRALLYLLTLLSIAALAATALIAMEPFSAGGALRGWWLWGHLLAAGGLTVLLPLLALSWAEVHRWRAAEQHVSSPATCLSFWVMVGGGAVALGSILLSMHHWFGTEGQAFLYAVHRYSALAVVVGALLHLYLGGLLRRRAD